MTRAFTALLWVAFAALVAAGWWQILWEGNEGLAIGLMAASLPVLFMATRASRMLRAGVRARWWAELFAFRGRGGSGGDPLDFLPWR